MKIPLLLLRIFIGWHFLYEGLIKLFQPEWSALAYLKGSYGFLSGFYNALASDPGMVQVIDFMNVWGMILLGTGLFLGLFIRLSSLSGILLLALYYFAYPPFGAAYDGSGADGHYWIVNTNLIEIIALFIICKFPYREFGMMRFITSFPGKKIIKSVLSSEESSTNIKGRREMLKGLAALPLFGGMMIGSIARAKTSGPDALSGATIALKKIDLAKLKGEMPRGKLAELEISRLIIGHNLIGGTAHARDLRYARQLFRQYNTQEKVLETYAIADQAGINMANITLTSLPLLNKYKKISGSKMMSIAQILVDLKGDDRLGFFRLAMEQGADTMYVQGSAADDLLQAGKLEYIQEAVEYVQSQGYPAGIGAHSIQVVIECEKAGLKPDYYFKTMHHDNYWSAHPREFRAEFQVQAKPTTTDHNQFHDNIFDIYPEQTVEVFKKVQVPLIGFKVLAAGAISPEDGFLYAFENGADFICVGMFDFQIVDDVNIVNKIFEGKINRNRPWYS